MPPARVISSYSYAKGVHDLRSPAEVVEIQVPNHCVGGLKGCFGVDGGLDLDLPFDSRLKLWRYLALGPSAPN